MDPTSNSLAVRTSTLALRTSGPQLFKCPASHRRRSTRFVVRAKSGRGRDVNLKKKGSKTPAKPAGGTVRVGPLESLFGFLFQGPPKRASSGRQDAKTVFVAGASGRLGSRCVRTVVSEGFKVIAGARNVDKAAQLLDDFVESGDLTPGQARSVRIVPFDVADEESIRNAIGNAAKVVCAVGANETGSFKDVDGSGNIQLINTAAEVGVKQFVLVTSLGTGKFILPASLLNLLGGCLSWKKRSEEALEKSGMQYTILRPGGMERPTDTFKETHNVVLAKRDTLGGGLVSRLQVAELVASCFANPELALGKCLEIVAETKAPLVEYADLLEQAEAEVTQEDLEEIQLAKAQQFKDRAAAAAQISNLTKSLEGIQARKTALLEQAQEAKSRASAISKENKPVVQASAKLLKEIASLQSAAEAKARQESAAQAILTAAKQAAREGILLSAQDQKEIAFPILQPEAAEAKRIKEEKELAAAEAAAAEKAAKQAAAEEARAAKETAAAEEAAAAEADKAAKEAASKLKQAAKKPVAKQKVVRTPARKAAGPETSPTAAKAGEPETPIGLEKVPSAPKIPVIKKAAAPTFKKKPPVKATERMSKPPPKATVAPAAASSASKVEPASVIEARVLAAVQKEKEERLAKEAKDREAASIKEQENQKKAAAAAAKAAQDALAKQAKEKEASIAKAKARIEEAASKAAAAAAAAAQLAEKKAAEAAKKTAEAAKKEAGLKSAAASPAEPTKSSTPTKASTPGQGFNLGKVFGKFKAPWAQPTPEELELKNRKTEVQAWISNWQSGAVAEKVLNEPVAEIQESEPSNSPPKTNPTDKGDDKAQESASEWIRKWRASSLEKQLPSSKSVKK